MEGTVEFDLQDSLVAQACKGVVAFDALAAAVKIGHLEPTIEQLKHLLAEAERTPDMFADPESAYGPGLDIGLWDHLLRIHESVVMDPEFEALAADAVKSPRIPVEQEIGDGADRLKWCSDKSKELWNRHVGDARRWLALLYAVRASAERSRRLIR